ncbi:V-type ATPase subunit [Candidatus Woesearchaeota archaeon]|nr:V-type ATPase subunit [Candidatus Woesearchaeota archaeon]
MNTIYPYLYTRGAFLKKKLLQGQDYERLLKMELPEIIKFLGETDYRKAIDELALSLSGVDLMEAALNRGLADFFRRIRGFADMQSRFILDTYLERWDVANAKTVLRIMFSDADREKAGLLLIPAGRHPAEYFLGLLKLPSIEDALRRMEFIDGKAREEAVSAYAGGKSLLRVETILDRQYYAAMFRQGKRMGAEHMMFKRFLGDEIAIINLKTVMRMRSEGIEPAEIRKYLIQKAGEDDAQLAGMLSAPGIEGMVTEARKGGYGKFLSSIGGATLLEAELACDRYLIGKYASSAYMNPLSIAPLLTIMFIKAAEVGNIKALVKAKQLGMGQEFIEGKAVVKCWR